MEMLASPSTSFSTHLSPPTKSKEFFVLLLLRCVQLATIVMALLQAYTMRHYLNEDGISYLDLGDAFLRGDWQAGINGTWSPLYPLIIGSVLALFQPSPYWEFATVKGINVAIFLASMAAFSWFLREVIQNLRNKQSGQLVPLPESLIRLLAWSIFLLASLTMTSVGFVTPDLLVNVFGLLAAASVARSHRLGVSWSLSAALGVFLGLGYLAKAPLLPMGMVFLLVYAWRASSWKERAGHFLLALLILACIAGPFIFALSGKLGRPAFTDASRINYLWFVNGVAKCRWQTERTDLGEPTHPPRQLHIHPNLYEYTKPISGTCPLWYDPGYWCEGLNPRLVLSEQLANLGIMTSKFFRIIARDLGIILLGSLILWALAWNTVPGPKKWQQALSCLAQQGPWFLIPSVASSLYVLVYVESRYLALYAMLALVGLVASIRFHPESWEQSRGRVVFIAVLFLIPGLGWMGWYGYQSFQEWKIGESGLAHEHWQISSELQKQGLQPGDRIGVVGDPLDCGWARLGRFRIVAEISQDAPLYWQSDENTKQQIMKAFQDAGAVAVVFTHPGENLEGTPVPYSMYQVKMLREN